MSILSRPASCPPVGQRPLRVNITRDAIPEEMRAAPRWAAATLRWETDRATGERKLEKDIKQAKMMDLGARSNDPSTYSTFEQAWEVYVAGQCDVLMFALGDGWAGVDFDHVRDTRGGTVDDWALREVQVLNSYTEDSSSGTGVHVVVHGTLPCDTGCKGAQIEVYDHGRWLGITSQRLPGTPATVEVRTVQLGYLVSSYFPKKVAHKERPRPMFARRQLPDDRKLLDMARRAKDDGRFAHLFDDGMVNGYQSDSEATAALVFKLAFWTRGDAERMDRLFRQSALMRDKWDAARGESTWGQLEIAHALDEVTEVYEPPMTTTTARTRTAIPFLTDLEAEELEPVQGILSNILYEETIAFIYGRSKRWKSFIALSWALSIATGLAWLSSHEVHQPGYVVYVVAEGARGTGKRIRAWKKQHKVTGETQLRLVPVAIHLLEPARVDDLCQVIGDRLGGTAPVLIVVDTLARSMAGGSENDTEDAERLVASADQIRRTFACCVLFVHHTGYDQTHMRGNTVFYNDADTVIHVVGENDAQAEQAIGAPARVICEKQRDEDEFIPFTVTTEKVVWYDDQLEECSSLVVIPYEDTGGGQPPALTTKDNVALDCLHTLMQAHPMGVTYTDWFKAVREAKVTMADRTFDRCIDRLKAGRLVVYETGTRRYREVEQWTGEQS